MSTKVETARAAYEIARSQWADEIGAMVADDDGALCDAATAMTATLDALIAAVREEEREAFEPLVSAAWHASTCGNVPFAHGQPEEPPCGHCAGCLLAAEYARIRARGKGAT